MSNMSYCRFQNTALDLDDCVEVIEAIIDGGGDDRPEPLADHPGNDELAAAKRLACRAYDLLSILLESQGKTFEDLENTADPERLIEQCVQDAQDTLKEQRAEADEDDEEDAE